MVIFGFEITYVGSAGKQIRKLLKAGRTVAAKKLFWDNHKKAYPDLADAIKAFNRRYKID